MQQKFLLEERKSHMMMNEIYFWTVTINQWQKLLWADEYKDVIINSLEFLTHLSKIDVFGFVIMPNHIHLIWRMLEYNGKESPQGSFLKFTAHKFRKMLCQHDSKRLAPYRVDSANKKHELWQRDPLAIHLYTRKVAFQKLDYLHNNPLADHWKLAKHPSNYRYSSAGFYYKNEDRFSFLKDLRKEF